MEASLVCPIGKLEPLGVIDSALIPRPRLMAEVTGSHVRHLCLQGKPGQGKTVLASQIFSGLKTSAFWYQFGHEDNSSQLLCRRLCAALLSKFDIEAGLPGENISLAEWVDQITAKLDTLPAPLTIFFEDLHQLESDGEARSLIIQLMRLASPSCRFVITSRTPVQELERLTLRGEALIIDDRKLAFSPEETQVLSSKRWDAANDELAMLLVDVTKGWPLATCSFLTTTPAAHKDRFAKDLLAQLHRCFAMLIAEFPPETAKMMFRLSQTTQFNKQIMTELDAASCCTELPLMLGDMVREEGAGHFRFQSELLHYLRAESPNHLNPQEIKTIRLASIDRAIAAGRLEDALDSLTSAGGIEELEKFLMAYGDQLPGYRWPMASTLLDRIPAVKRDSSPYISLFYGRFMGEVSPARAVDPIRASIDMFVEAGDDFGELKSSIYLLELQVTIAKELNTHAVSRRIQELEPRHGRALPLSDQILLYTVLGGIAVYFPIDRRSTKAVLDQAEILNASVSNDLTLKLTAFRALDHIFHQQASSALVQIEALGKVNSNLIRRSDHLLLYAVRANYLAMIGDAGRLAALLQEAHDAIDEQLLIQSQSGAVLKLLGANMRQLTGDVSGAVTELSEASADFCFVAEGELKDYWCSLMAHTLAVAGRSSEALGLSSEVTVENRAPVSWYRMQLVSASIQAMSGDPLRAQEMFIQVLEMGDDYPHFKTVAHGLMFLSIRNQDASKADLHLRQWVQRICSEEHPRIHSVGYSHEGIADLVKAGGAVMGFDGYADAARRIAETYLDKGLSSSYDTVPFLRIATDVCTISLGNLRLDLTNQQRRTIYLVSLMPDHTVALEVLAERLWPDTPNPDSRLYKMLSRLRKVFVEAGHDPADYIRQTPGLITLINIRLDVREYQMLAARSIDLSNSGHGWSATTTALSAIEAWNGVFNETMRSMNLPLEGFEQQYELTCLNLVDHVLTSATKTRRLIAAIMQPHLAEPSNVSIASALAILFRASDDLLSLVQLRQRVSEALRDIDLPEVDIVRQVGEL